MSDRPAGAPPESAPTPFAVAAAEPQAPSPAERFGALTNAGPHAGYQSPYLLSADSPYRPSPAWPPPARPTMLGRRVMPARPRELFGAIGLVAAFDFAIWSGGDLGSRGVGQGVFLAAAPAIVVLAARARRFTLRAGAIAGMLVALALRAAYNPSGFALFLGLSAIFALAIALRSRTSFLTEVVSAFGMTFVTLPLRFEATVKGARRMFRVRDGKAAAIVVPFLLTAVFAAIFAFANPLVAKWLSGIGSVFSLASPVRIFTWMFLFWGAALLVRPAVARYTVSEAATTEDEASAAALSLARNALIPLNALFLVYNALDAAYLWAGSPPPGVSAQAYAHGGAAWLTVALVLLTIVVGVMFKGALAHDAQARRIRTLAFVWLGQGAVLALGTFRRLSIHISTSGLSNVRILGLLGTAVVAFGLVLVGMKLDRQRSFFWLLRRQLDAVAVALVGFALLPTHLISAHFNVPRVRAKEYQSLVHVEEQAREAESAAALLPLVHHEDPRVREGMAALLLEERDELRKRPGGFGSFAFAPSRTLRALEAASPELLQILDDIDRRDAIRQWEYIRNSSIEGEIALSEIDKVKRAPTRAMKLTRGWAAIHGVPVATQESDIYSDVPGSAQVVYAPTVRLNGEPLNRDEIAPRFRRIAAYQEPSIQAIAGAEPPRREVTLDVTAVTRDDERVTDHVTLILEQSSVDWSADPIWHVVEVRGRELFVSAAEKAAQKAAQREDAAQ